MCSHGASYHSGHSEPMGPCYHCTANPRPRRAKRTWLSNNPLAGAMALVRSRHWTSTGHTRSQCVDQSVGLDWHQGSPSGASEQYWRPEPAMPDSGSCHLPETPERGYLAILARWCSRHSLQTHPRQIRSIGSVLKVGPTDNRQGRLQPLRPLLVGSGEPPHLVRCQSKISECRPERLTSVDRIQKLLTQLDR